MDIFFLIWDNRGKRRKVSERTFSGITPQLGYGGMDEDQGQMGALHILMQIGLFSIDGATSMNPCYEITSPVFDEVIIHLDQEYCTGRKFRIKTYSNSSENCYVQAARLNGKIHDSFLLPHKEVEKGGLLELWMGNTPNESWGIENRMMLNTN